MSNRNGRSPRVFMLIWAYPPEFAGAGRQLQTLARRLVETGVDVTVLCSSANCTDASEHDAGVRVVRLGTGATGNRRLKRFGRRAFAWLLWRRADWDIVHVHGVSAATYAGVLAARFAGKRSILKFTLDGDDDPLTVGRTRFGKLKLGLLARFDRYIAISSALRLAIERSPLDTAKIRAIANAVDPLRFNPLSPEKRDAAHAALCDTLNWPGTARVVAFIGGIEQRKGVDVLIDAWPDVVARAPDARLALIGPYDHSTADPGYKRALESALQKRGLEETVRFLGKQDHPEHLLQAAEVFAFPSRAEGLPSAMIEAQMVGLPCVAAQLPGITEEVIAPGETGIAIPQDDPAAMARALTSLLDNPEEARAMGERAQMRAIERFSLDAIAAQYRRLYGELL